MVIADLLAANSGSIPVLIRAHAAANPDHRAIVVADRAITYRELDRDMDRVAAALQRDRVPVGGAIVIIAAPSIAYLTVYLGAVRAGVCVAPLQPSATPEALARMAADAGAHLVFSDTAWPDAISLEALDAWWSDAPAAEVAVPPDAPFNLIYSSGTTGAPKGIVQSHRMRWAHVRRGEVFGYGPSAVTLVATPLYSNTTLVILFPTLALGGTAVVMPKFEPAAFLALSAAHRVTHAMLVPVQYERLLRHPDFDRTDLSSYRMKLCTSAPFSAALKAEVLRRWPGGLVEYFGMTEGGGTCILVAHRHPDKLATVGQPAEGHDVRIIDDAGRELPRGEVGEIVGASPAAMMTGYHNQPAATAAAEWHDPTGKRFIRTGDLGCFDAEGFLSIVGRKKDVIISGGFNIYPVDLEAALLAHPAVREAAVVGVASPRWGETPVGVVVLASAVDAEALCRFANARLGATQRLAAVQVRSELPRNAIGKVLKRQLRAELETVDRSDTAR